MGRNITDEVAYKCTNDCDMGGCPGHKMRLSFCRSSDTVAVEIDGKPEYYFCDNSFAALKKLMGMEAK